MQPERTAHVLRRRHGFTSLVPISRSSKWLRVSWLWWTWIYLPKPIADRVENMLEAMDDATRAGPPSAREQDRSGR